MHVRPKPAPIRSNDETHNEEQLLTSGATVDETTQADGDPRAVVASRAACSLHSRRFCSFRPFRNVFNLSASTSVDLAVCAAAAAAAFRRVQLLKFATRRKAV